MARSLALSSENPVLNDELDAIEQLLLRAVDFPTVLEIRVLGPHGEGLAHAARTLGGDPRVVFDPPDARLTLPTLQTAQLQRDSDSQRVVAWHPITAGNLLGWVQLTLQHRRVCRTCASASSGHAGGRRPGRPGHDHAADPAAARAAAGHRRGQGLRGRSGARRRPADRGRPRPDRDHDPVPCAERRFDTIAGPAPARSTRAWPSSAATRTRWPTPTSGSSTLFALSPDGLVSLDAEDRVQLRQPGVLQPHRGWCPRLDDGTACRRHRRADCANCAVPTAPPSRDWRTISRPGAVG